MNVELSGVQQRNLEGALGRPVIDRMNIIIDIFGQRARTREAKLQVRQQALLCFAAYLTTAHLRAAWVDSLCSYRNVHNPAIPAVRPCHKIERHSVYSDIAEPLRRHMSVSPRLGMLGISARIFVHCPRQNGAEVC